MLFNSSVHQIGGGTELTTINVNISPGDKVRYPIPKSATLICFCGNANGSSAAIYKRIESGIDMVVNALNYTMEITPSSDAITITSKGVANYYRIIGALVYK